MTGTVPATEGQSLSQTRGSGPEGQSLSQTRA
jgi:hypothetical protein